MPGGDQTGPTGMGPMTGRAAGYCAGYPTPGYASAGGGRGFGGGGGRGGRGRRNRFYATGMTGWQRAAAGMPAFGTGQSAAAPFASAVVPPAASKDQELGMLRQQAETMEQQMRQFRERIQQLETEGQTG